MAFFLIGIPAWSCTMVDGDRIVGAHMASEIPAFAEIDAEIDLGPAPHAGARRVYLPSEIERLARRHGIDTPAGEACFERSTQLLNPEILGRALRAAGEESPEILDFSRNALPLGEVEFSRSGLDRFGLWRGRLVYGDHRSIPIWVRIRAPGVASPEVTVERGETVVVEVVRGGVKLEFEAAAESAGRIGQSVVVRNPANGKRFRATVEGKQKVAILP